MDCSTVIIIGGGPAGCAAGITLARAGIPVTLIEATPFPRHRPGESLHPGVEPILETLGVVDAINSAGFLRHRGINVVLKAECRKRFEAFGRDERGDWLGYQAYRPQFDRILLQEAELSGVRLLQPCRPLAALVGADGEVIGLETDCGCLTSTYVLDATGRSRWMTQQLGVRWCDHSPRLTARYGYAHIGANFNDGDSGNPEMRCNGLGWTWLARVRQDLLAWVSLRFDSSDPGPKWIPEELQEMQSAHSSRGADVTWRIAEQLSGPGWFLLGDAASVLDPAASHGVLRALMSGMKAANLIIQCERNQANFTTCSTRYSEWIQAWYSNDRHRLKALYQTLVSQDPTVKFPSPWLCTMGVMQPSLNKYAADMLSNSIRRLAVEHRRSRLRS